MHASYQIFSGPHSSCRENMTFECIIQILTPFSNALNMNVGHLYIWAACCARSVDIRPRSPSLNWISMLVQHCRATLPEVYKSNSVVLRSSGPVKAPDPEGGQRWTQANTQDFTIFCFHQTPNSKISHYTFLNMLMWLDQFWKQKTFNDLRNVCFLYNWYCFISHYMWRCHHWLCNKMDRATAACKWS